MTVISGCPICLEHNAAIIDLDGAALDDQQVVAVRFECINCGYASKVQEKLLTKELFRDQLAQIRESILKIGYQEESRPEPCDRLPLQHGKR